MCLLVNYESNSHRKNTHEISKNNHESRGRDRFIRVDIRWALITELCEQVSNVLPLRPASRISGLSYGRCRCILTNGDENKNMQLSFFFFVFLFENRQIRV